jgi:hypothetical protein
MTEIEKRLEKLDRIEAFNNAERTICCRKMRLREFHTALTHFLENNGDSSALSKLSENKSDPRQDARDFLEATKTSGELRQYLVSEGLTHLIRQ